MHLCHKVYNELQDLELLGCDLPLFNLLLTAAVHVHGINIK